MTCLLFLFLSDDGKSGLIKRGPGRPRKRKYFGSGTKSGKTTPTNSPTADELYKEEMDFPGSEHQVPVSEVKAVSEEGLAVREIEPVKRKKKKTVQEQDGGGGSLRSSPLLRQSPTEHEVRP